MKPAAAPEVSMPDAAPTEVVGAAAEPEPVPVEPPVEPPEEPPLEPELEDPMVEELAGDPGTPEEEPEGLAAPEP